jgi:hypothetical protein
MASSIGENEMAKNMRENENQDHSLSSTPLQETLHVIYEAQWQDLHHCRNQDWRLCNLIILGLLGVGGLKIFGQFPNLQIVSSLVFASVSLLAIGVTERHRALFAEKMEAIRKLENLLHAPVLFKPHSRWQKCFKVQHFLEIIYILFTIFFVYIACVGTGQTVP